MGVIEATETHRKAAKIADKRKLRRDDVNYRTMTGFLGKLQALLGFALHVGERISYRQKPVIQVMARVCRVCEIADAIGGIKRSTEQTSRMSRSLLNIAKRPLPRLTLRGVSLTSKDAVS